jgi:hypothetical protein
VQLVQLHELLQMQFVHLVAPAFLGKSCISYFLLHIVEEVLPISGAEWEAVYVEHCAPYPDKDCNPLTLKQMIYLLVGARVPTGNPTPNTQVAHALAINELIVAKLELSDGVMKVRWHMWRMLTIVQHHHKTQILFCFKNWLQMVQVLVPVLRAWSTMIRKPIRMAAMQTISRSLMTK